MFFVQKNIPLLAILLFLSLVLVQFATSITNVLSKPAQDFQVFYFSGKQITAQQNPYLKLPDLDPFKNTF